MDPKYAQANTISRRFWREVVTGGTYRNIVMALGSLFQKETNGVKVFLGGGRRAPVTSRVSRTEVLRSKEDSSVQDEVLTISGVVVKPFDVSVLINIFLQLPEADENTPQHCVEFLGGVVANVEALRDGMDSTVESKFIKTIGIRDTLQILNITRQKSLDVTFVAAWDPKHDSGISIRITGLQVVESTLV